MALYLSADGGGTKLNVVLFDEQANLLASAQAGGVNANFSKDEAVRSRCRMALAHCLVGVKTIDTAYVGVAGGERILLETARELTDIQCVRRLGEGAMALAAGAGTRFGVLAQAGTGSDVFLIQPGFEDVIGGWGSLLGDEGSGYDIGLQALRAAIYDSDGRGAQTALTGMIIRHFGGKTIEDILQPLLRSETQRQDVAACALLASEAARKGDAVALELYKNAGASMARQAIALLERHGGRWQGPVVLGGSAWKGHPAMRARFVQDLESKFPGTCVESPAFEAVAGGAACMLLERGWMPEKVLATLKTSFSSFLYQQEGI